MRWWFLCLCLTAAAAAWADVPMEISGQAVYVPYPIKISVDGKLDDWKSVPAQIVDRGPSPSKTADSRSFRFSVAADEKTLYVLMLVTDSNLVSGKHGADFWNEDSLEFYVNFGSLSLTKYSGDVAQYRVVPADVGNVDIKKLTASGQNLDAFPLTAKVFKTSDGWGFEGSLPLPLKAKPEHGKAFGFQAQLNGASAQDRDVKLIWSLADKADNSWQNPSLFGQALFFKLGSRDIPLPVAAVPPAPVAQGPQPSALAVNQVGYFPRAVKTGALVQASPVKWSLVDATTKAEVASGTTVGDKDPTSADTVQIADFSSYTKDGTYVLVIGGVTSSPFVIGDAYSALAKDALHYFYLTRSGVELKPEFAGGWARPAGHLSDKSVPVYEGYDLLVDGSGGWYDAGDFGKYVVNGGITVWTLQNAYERDPAAFGDGTPVPERGNGKPDVLDEARWELRFLLNMQIPSGKPLAGMSFHKLHDRRWSGVPSALPETMNNANRQSGRFVYEPTTAATLNLAAVAAQASRVWKKLDPGFSAQTLKAAQTAWAAAKAHPQLIAGNVPGEGGGNYDDATVADDFYWAACELYAATGGKEYLDFVKSSPYFAAATSMNWADTATLGTLTLLSVPGDIDVGRLKENVVSAADVLVKQGAQGYRGPLDEAGYVWGSNSVALNAAILLAAAYDLTKKPQYRDAVVHSVDYLLGVNALRKSFVTGYGSNPVSHPHHRVWGNDPDAGYPPPPPGVLAGGPNASIQDPEMKAADLASLPIAKRYLDRIGSYATNEVAINWNAPLFWVATWLETQYGSR